jgi:NADPH-dependent ferric siderophore reductase
MESVRRNLRVQQVHSLSPRMLRITFSGEELAGFNSPSPGDHVKLLFPMGQGTTTARDYTPRRFDREANTLTIDFALHDGGVGSAWAQSAAPGDQLQIVGPRGSTIINAEGAWWLLIGDETALPSIGRRIEESTAGAKIISLVAVTDHDEEQIFETESCLTTHWVHRPDTAAGEAGPLQKALSLLKLPDGPGFIWIGSEAEVARELRTYVLETLSHPAEWVKTSAYWTKTSAGPQDR